MQRDLQIKHFKSMYRELHGDYPHHIKFENVDDDELDQMFNEARDAIDAKKAHDEVDADVMAKYMTKQPNTMAMMMVKR